MDLTEYQTYIMPYVVTIGPPEQPIYFGPDIKSRLDAYYVKETLGINVIINMRPLTDEEHWNEENKASPYMIHFKAEGNPIPDLANNPPALYREAALPSEPLDQQTEKKQIDFYVSRARKVVSHLKENKLTAYIHHRDGTYEEAFLGFLVWYLLDKQSCPWENLTQWLISDEVDQKQVLPDDEAIELFGKMVKQLEETKKNPIMMNWLKNDRPNKIRKK